MRDATRDGRGGELRGSRAGRRAGARFRGGRIAASILAAVLLAAAAPALAAKPAPEPYANSGLFVVVWADPSSGTGREAPPRYWLVPDQEEPVELLLDPGMLASRGGATRLDLRRVDVLGTRAHVRNGAVRVETLRPDAASAAEGPTGAQRWAVLLCRFSGPAEAAAPTRARVETMLGAGDAGMPYFWREASGGALDLAGSQVFGWFDLGSPRDAYLRDPFRPADVRNFDLQRAARDCSAVADAEVFFPDYEGVAFVFDRDPGGFSQTGAAVLERDAVARTYRAAWLAPAAVESPAALAHALGHAYGLPHSSSLGKEPGEGGRGAMSSGRGCAGSHPDLGCLPEPLIAYHEELLGWLPSGTRYLAPVGTGLRATLAPAGDRRVGKGAYRVAVIPIPGPAGEFYTVEAVWGNPDDPRGEGRAGVLMHRVDPTREDRQAQAVEVRRGERTGALWASGEAFRDAEDGIAVVIGPESSGAFDVSITRDPVAGGGARTEAIQAAPPNNDCSAATVISTLTFTDTISTTQATSPGTDPVPPCGNGSKAKSVWYKFTAPGSGTVSVDTFGSDYDTILSTWTGACGSLTAVPGGCNDDYPGGLESSLTLSVTSGVTYLFMVSDSNTTGGSLTFSLSFASPPANDTCATAKELFSPAAASAFTVPAGGLDGPTPPCGNGSKANSVWYRFTAAGPGTLVVDTFGSDYNTILSAWTGACDGLAALAGACNDDANGGLQSRLEIPLAGIQTLYFMATASAADGGSLLLNLEFRPSAGEIGGPSGPPLLVAPAAGSDITLSWSRSCMGLESDYAVYEGAIGSFASHVSRQCSTAGATSATLTPSTGNRYYLVVPRTGFFEGSYGQRSTGAERPAAAAACVAQAIGACAPACAHDKCVSGAGLSTACNAVVSELCALDAFCCSGSPTAWDSICISEIRTLAKNLTCPESQGSCSHTLCSTGAALVSGCDSTKVTPSCTAAICAATPACCTTAWDAACVAQVNTVCGYDCN